MESNGVQRVVQAKATTELSAIRPNSTFDGQHLSNEQVTGAGLPVDAASREQNLSD